MEPKHCGAGRRSSGYSVTGLAAEAAKGAFWRILVISVVFACLVPVTAVAKRGYFATDPSSDMQVQLRGSGGYGISLSANGGFVSLVVQGHHATVDYFASGAAGKGKIKARFGSLGRVALRFHPRGKARLHKDKEPVSDCRGGDSLIQPGVFVGKLDFEGEQGYTRIHANRIKGTVTHTKRQVCKTSGSEEGEEGLLSSLKGIILSAAADENGTSFNASRIESKTGPSGSAFSATLVESPQPGFSVFRSIQTTAKDPAAFSVATSHGHVDEATVTPPAPFSGSATYQRAVAKKSETWVGTLAGDFPGLGTVSLAGPKFCAEGVLFKGCNGSLAWVVSFFG